MTNTVRSTNHRLCHDDDTCRMMKKSIPSSCLFVGVLSFICGMSNFSAVGAFLPRPYRSTCSLSSTHHHHHPHVLSYRGGALSTRRFNFFKDMLEKAFENDDNLSKDEKLKGQIDGPEIDPQQEEYQKTMRSSKTPLTSTQEKWRNLYGGNKNAAAATTTTKTTSASSGSSILIEGQTYVMDFFLTGVPSKDPSSDLFGSKVNISSRDRQVGLAVPDKATLTGVEVEFLPNGKCRCLTDTAFTTKVGEKITDNDNDNDNNNNSGDWKLSSDGKQIRFRIPVQGYTRTVETRGSIQSVYWSNEEDKVRQTSTSYTIPPGWMYGEAEIMRSSMTAQQQAWSNGILKVEQTTGMLGAGTKMVPCGKFTSKRVVVVNKSQTASTTNVPSASTPQVKGSI